MSYKNTYKNITPVDGRKDFEVLLAYGDLHIPYENEKRREILLKIINMLEPDYLLSGGDDIDAEALSTYTKYIDGENSLQRDLDGFYHFSETLNRRFPSLKKIMVKDNHLYQRLENQKKVVKWLQSLDYMRYEHLIKADEYKWDIHTEYIWKESIIFTHGDDEKGSIDNPVNTVRNNLKRRGYSIVRFHTHVTGLELHNNKGKTAFAFQVGTLQDVNKASYIKSKERSNWTGSLGIFYLHKKTKEFFVEPILFFNDAVMFRGQLLQ